MPPFIGGLEILAFKVLLFTFSILPPLIGGLECLAFIVLVFFVSYFSTIASFHRWTWIYSICNARVDVFNINLFTFFLFFLFLFVFFPKFCTPFSMLVSICCSCISNRPCVVTQYTFLPESSLSQVGELHNLIGWNFRFSTAERVHKVSISKDFVQVRYLFVLQPFSLYTQIWDAVIRFVVGRLVRFDWFEKRN